MTAPKLILASASPYKRELLSRLGLLFDGESPDIDESPLAGESPAILAERLALAKADKIADIHPGHWVIGCDQTADLNGLPLGKPGNTTTAKQHLRECAGKAVHFHSAVALVGPDFRQCRLSTTTVRFRALSDQAIDNYVAREPAVDCAGSFKAEALGIALFEEIDSKDPTSLIGLPLITVCDLLSAAGFDALEN
jgi:septum formation protein